MNFSRLNFSRFIIAILFFIATHAADKYRKADGEHCPGDCFAIRDFPGAKDVCADAGKALGEWDEQIEILDHSTSECQHRPDGCFGHINFSHTEWCDDGEVNSVEWGTYYRLCVCPIAWCDKGEYFQSDGNDYSSGSCNKCSSGKFKDNENYCGYTSSCDSQCQNCAKGKYASSTGSTTCSSCIAGKYQHETGKDSCHQCPAGTWSSTTGADGENYCNECPTGTWSSTLGASSSSTCTKCGKGKHNSNTGQVASIACKTCDPGEYQDIKGQAECKQCPKGRWRDDTGGESVSDCTECGKGKYNDDEGSEGESACTECPVGKWSSAFGADSSSDCIPCSKGTANNSKGRTSACQQCVKGYYQQHTGQSSCSSCIAGKYGVMTGAQSESQGCDPCQKGKYQESSGKDDCNDCPIGTASNVLGSSSSSNCNDCDIGKYATAGSTECTKCPSGTYQNEKKQGSCKPCPKGTYFSGTGATSEQDCVPCPEGTYNSVEGVSWLSQCLDCPKGTWSDVTGLEYASQCINCLQGTASNTLGAKNINTCVDCDPGYKAPQEGMDECVICAKGTYQPDSGKANCEPCIAGTYLDFLGSSDVNDCTECPVGTSSNQLAAPELDSCAPCSPGKYADVTGLAECKKCDEGFYQPDFESTECIACGVGKYLELKGKTQESDCELCFSGTAAPLEGNPSSQSCEPCDAGYFSGEGSSVCSPCPVGTHQDLPGQSECIPCEFDYFADTSASIYCTDCQAECHNTNLYEGNWRKMECGPVDRGYCQPVPSTSPSVSPSYVPSVNPTVNPSTSPTVDPTKAPSITSTIRILASGSEINDESISIFYVDHSGFEVELGNVDLHFYAEEFEFGPLPADTIPAIVIRCDVCGSMEGSVTREVNIHIATVNGVSYLSTVQLLEMDDQWQCAEIPPVNMEQCALLQSGKFSHAGTYHLLNFLSEFNTERLFDLDLIPELEFRHFADFIGIESHANAFINQVYEYGSDTSFTVTTAIPPFSFTTEAEFTYDVEASEIRMNAVFETIDIELGPFTLNFESLNIYAKLHRDYQTMSMQTAVSLCDGAIVAPMGIQLATSGEPEHCDSVTGQINFNGFSLNSLVQCAGITAEYVPEIFSTLLSSISLDHAEFTFSPFDNCNEGRMDFAVEMFSEKHAMSLFFLDASSVVEDALTIQQSTSAGNELRMMTVDKIQSEDKVPVQSNVLSGFQATLVFDQGLVAKIPGIGGILGDLVSVFPPMFLSTTIEGVTTDSAAALSNAAPADFQSSGASVLFDITDSDPLKLLIPENTPSEDIYVILTQQSAQQRFGGIISGNSFHFVIVRREDESWLYPQNNQWKKFMPRASDVLIAKVLLSTDGAISNFDVLNGHFKMIHGIGATLLDSDFTFEFSSNEANIIFETPSISFEKAPSAWSLNPFTVFDFSIPSVSTQDFSFALQANQLNENPALGFFGLSFPQDALLKAEVNSMGTHVTLDLPSPLSLTNGGVGKVLELYVQQIEFATNPSMLGVSGSASLGFIPVEEPIEVEFYGAMQDTQFFATGFIEELDFTIGKVTDLTFSVDINGDQSFFEVSGALSCLNTAISLQVPSLQDVVQDTCVFYEASLESEGLSLASLSSCFGADINMDDLNAPEILKEVISPLLEIEIVQASVMISTNCPEFRVDLAVSYENSIYELKLFQNRPSLESIQEPSTAETGPVTQMLSNLFPEEDHEVSDPVDSIDMSKPMVTLWLEGKIFDAIADEIFSQWFEFPIAFPDLAYGFQPIVLLDENLPKMPLTLNAMLSVPPSGEVDYAMVEAVVLDFIEPTIQQLTQPFALLAEQKLAALPDISEAPEGPTGETNIAATLQAMENCGDDGHAASQSLLAVGDMEVAVMQALESALEMDVSEILSVFDSATGSLGAMSIPTTLEDLLTHPVITDVPAYANEFKFWYSGEDPVASTSYVGDQNVFNIMEANAKSQSIISTIMESIASTNANGDRRSLSIEEISSEVQQSLDLLLESFKQIFESFLEIPEEIKRALIAQVRYNGYMENAFDDLEEKLFALDLTKFSSELHQLCNSIGDEIEILYISLISQPKVAVESVLDQKLVLLNQGVEEYQEQLNSVTDLLGVSSLVDPELESQLQAAQNIISTLTESVESVFDEVEVAMLGALQPFEVLKSDACQAIADFGETYDDIIGLMASFPEFLVALENDQITVQKFLDDTIDEGKLLLGNTAAEVESLMSQIEQQFQSNDWAAVIPSFLDVADLIHKFCEVDVPIYLAYVEDASNMVDLLQLVVNGEAIAAFYEIKLTADSLSINDVTNAFSLVDTSLSQAVISLESIINQGWGLVQPGITIIDEKATLVCDYVYVAEDWVQKIMENIPAEIQIPITVLLTGSNGNRRRRNLNTATELNSEPALSSLLPSINSDISQILVQIATITASETDIKALIRNTANDLVLSMMDFDFSKFDGQAAIANFAPNEINPTESIDSFWFTRRRALFAFEADVIADLDILEEVKKLAADAKAECENVLDLTILMNTITMAKQHMSNFFQISSTLLADIDSHAVQLQGAIDQFVLGFNTLDFSDVYEGNVNLFDWVDQSCDSVSESLNQAKSIVDMEFQALQFINTQIAKLFTSIDGFVDQVQKAADAYPIAMEQALLACPTMEAVNAFVGTSYVTEVSSIAAKVTSTTDYMPEISQFALDAEAYMDSAMLFASQANDDVISLFAEVELIQNQACALLSEMGDIMREGLQQMFDIESRIDDLFNSVQNTQYIMESQVSHATFTVEDMINRVQTTQERAEAKISQILSGVDATLVEVDDVVSTVENSISTITGANFMQTITGTFSLLVSTARNVVRRVKDTQNEIDRLIVDVEGIMTLVPMVIEEFELAHETVVDLIEGEETVFTKSDAVLLSVDALFDGPFGSFLPNSDIRNNLHTVGDWIAEVKSLCLMITDLLDGNESIQYEGKTTSTFLGFGRELSILDEVRNELEVKMSSVESSLNDFESATLGQLSQTDLAAISGALAMFEAIAEKTENLPSIHVPLDESCEDLEEYDTYVSHSGYVIAKRDSIFLRCNSNSWEKYAPQLSDVLVMQKHESGWVSLEGETTYEHGIRMGVMDGSVSVSDGFYSGTNVLAISHEGFNADILSSTSFLGNSPSSGLFPNIDFGALASEGIELLSSMLGIDLPEAELVATFRLAEGLKAELSFYPALNPTKESPVSDFFQLEVERIHFVQNPMYVGVEGNVLLDLGFLYLDSSMVAGVSNDGSVSLVADLNEPFEMNFGIFDIIVTEGHVDYTYTQGTHAMNLKAGFSSATCAALQGDLSFILTPEKNPTKCSHHPARLSTPNLTLRTLLECFDFDMDIQVPDVVENVFETILDSGLHSIDTFVSFNCPEVRFDFTINLDGQLHDISMYYTRESVFEMRTASKETLMGIDSTLETINQSPEEKLDSLKQRNLEGEELEREPVNSDQMTACLVGSPSLLLDLTDWMADWVELPAIQAMYCFTQDSSPLGLGYATPFPRNVQEETPISYDSSNAITEQVKQSVSISNEGYVMLSMSEPRLRVVTLSEDGLWVSGGHHILPKIGDTLLCKINSGSCSEFDSVDWFFGLIRGAVSVDMSLTDSQLHVQTAQLISLDLYHHFLFNFRAATDISIEPGLNLRFPKDGFSLDFLEHFNIPAPVNFGIDLALYSKPQDSDNGALRVDIALDLDLGSSFSILDFSVKRLVIVNEPWFAQAEVRLTFWDMELHANIIHTNDWQQVEFSFDGDLTLFPQFLRITKMSGILRKEGESGLLIYLKPTVEFCGNVKREFTAMYDTTSECTDMKFRMQDPISIGDMVSALCLQSDATVFRSSFVKTILDTSVMNLEVDYSECEQSTLFRTSAIVSLPYLTAFQMEFASDSSENGGWYFEAQPQNPEWNFLQSGLLSNFLMGDLVLNNLYLGFGHDMTPPSAPCATSANGVFFAGTLKIPNTGVWDLLTDAIGQDTFDVCGEYSESLSVSTELEPRQILGDAFEITKSSFHMNTGSNALALSVSTDIEMWWDERWEMNLWCQWSPNGWTMTYSWPNTATFDAWFVELGVADISVTVFEDSSYKFSAEAWLDNFRFKVDSNPEEYFHLKMLEPTTIHIQDVIEIFFNGLGLDIPGVDSVVKSAFLNFEATDLEIYCTAGDQWRCMPLGKMTILGMTIDTEDFMKVAYHETTNEPVYYFSLNGIDLLYEFGLDIILDVLPSSLQVEFVLSMDDIGKQSIFGQQIKVSEGFNFYVKMDNLQNEAFPWSLVYDITTVNSLVFRGNVKRTSFEIAGVLDTQFEFGDFVCDNVEPYIKYVMSPYYMEIGLRGEGSWDDVQGSIEFFFRFPSSQYGFLFTASNWDEPFGIPGIMARQLEIGASLTTAVPSEIYGSALLEFDDGATLFALIWLNLGVAPPTFAYELTMVDMSLGHAVSFLDSLVDGLLPFDLDLSGNPLVKGLLDSFSFGDVSFSLCTASMPVEVGSYTLHPGFEINVNNVNIFDGLIDIPRVYMKCTQEFSLDAGCEAKMAIRAVDTYFLHMMNGMLDFRMNLQGMPSFGFKFTLLKFIRIFTVDMQVGLDTGSGSALMQFGLSWGGEARCNMENNKRNGDNGFCSRNCKCNWGEGNCNNDDLQCAQGLVCKSDVGFEFGFSKHVSLCFPPDNAPMPPLDMSHHDFWISMSAADLYGFSGFAFEGFGLNLGKAVGHVKKHLIDVFVMPVVQVFQDIYNMISNPSFSSVADFIDRWPSRPNQRRALQPKEFAMDLQKLVTDLRQQYAECQVDAIAKPAQSARCWMIMLQLRSLESAITKTIGRRGLFINYIVDAAESAWDALTGAIEAAWNWAFDMAKRVYNNLKDQVNGMINRFNSENNDLILEIASGGVKRLLQQGRINLKYGGKILGVDLGIHNMDFCLPVEIDCAAEMAQFFWQQTKSLFRLNLLSEFQSLLDLGRRELADASLPSASFTSEAALGEIPVLKASEAPAVLTRGQCQSVMDLPSDAKHFQQTFFKEIQRPFWMKDRTGKKNLFMYSASCGSHVRVGAATIVYKNVHTNELESHGTHPNDNPSFRMRSAVKHSGAGSASQPHLKHFATFVEKIENIM